MAKCIFQNLSTVLTKSVMLVIGGLTGEVQTRTIPKRQTPRNVIHHREVIIKPPTPVKVGSWSTLINRKMSIVLTTSACGCSHSSRFWSPFQGLDCCSIKHILILKINGYLSELFHIIRLNCQARPFLSLLTLKPLLRKPESLKIIRRELGCGRNGIIVIMLDMKSIQVVVTALSDFKAMAKDKINQEKSMDPHLDTWIRRYPNAVQ